ncbi:MAG: hypothetical protein IKX79_03170 [Desulfovibrionaceae bacterium]|nr:hypothetical protein [Desulfovibrionaceae bacterium]
MADYRKIVSSFTDGRIRLRHERLKHPSAVSIIKEKLSRVAGCHSVECNPRTGSVLVLYDAAVLSRDDLVRIGQECADLLDGEPPAGSAGDNSAGTAREGQEGASPDQVPSGLVPSELVPLDSAEWNAPREAGRRASGLDAFLAGRGVRRAVNRGMLVSLSLTFVFSLMGRKSLHVAAGSLLGLLAASHMYRHRHSL